MILVVQNACLSLTSGSIVRDFKYRNIISICPFSISFKCYSSFFFWSSFFKATHIATWHFGVADERIIILSLSGLFYRTPVICEQFLIELTRTLRANTFTEMHCYNSGSGTWPTRVACDSLQREGKAWHDFSQLAGKDYRMITNIVCQIISSLS